MTQTTDEQELEALREMAIDAGDRAVFPEDRETRGVYTDEECIIFEDAPRKLSCWLFGHKTDRDPTLDPETKTIIGESTWCRRCGEVLKHDLNGE